MNKYHLFNCGVSNLSRIGRAVKIATPEFFEQLPDLRRCKRCDRWRATQLKPAPVTQSVDVTGKGV